MPLNFEPENITGVLLADGAWRQVTRGTFQAGAVNFASGNPEAQRKVWWFRFADAEREETIAGPLDGVLAIRYDD